MPPSQTRIAIYTRLSRDTGNEFSSCDAQFEACLSFLATAASRGWVWCGQRYDDLGQSGEKLDRPGLSQLLHDIRRGRVDGLVIHRLDRLSRKLADITALLTEFRSRNISLAIVADPTLGTSATDMLVLKILGSFAEFEREMIRDRLADTRAAMKRKGLRVAGKVPYGYTTDPRTKQLLINRQQAKRVRSFFAWAAEGQTPTAIAAIAKSRRWLTNQSPAYPEGGHWTPRQVSEILVNPVYRGLIRTPGGGTAPGQHEPLVTAELFAKARDAIAGRRVSGTPRGNAAFDWPLRGLVTCGRCGRVMSTSVIGYKSLLYRHYRCRSHAGGRPPCKGVAAPAHELEQLAIRALSALDPERFRSPANRLTAADFRSLWDTLTHAERAGSLAGVIDRLRFDSDRGTVQVRLRKGAVGAVAGVIMNRPGSEPASPARNREG